MRLQVTTRDVNYSRRRILAGTALIVSAILSSAASTLAQGVPFEIMTARQAHEAAANGEIILVDIRTPEEWAETGIGDGAIALDMRVQEFVPTLLELRSDYPDLPIAMICRTGNRSDYVIDALAQQGFPNLIDVKEGMVGGRHGDGWLKHGLPIYAGTPVEINNRLAIFLNR